MLFTKNCIITGKIATIFGGHVVLNKCFVDDDCYANICVIAGFADEDVLNNTKSEPDGCFGDYKPEYGIEVGW